MERLAGRVVLLWGWRRALLAFAAGAFAVLGQAPYDFFAACFVSFPLLVWLVDGVAGDGGGRRLSGFGRAFALGWWFGFGYFLAGLWWVGNALLVEAESFAWALPLAVIGLPALIALFYGAAVALARFLWSDNAGRIAALAFGFGIAEWLRTFLFTGFPWNAVGHAAMPVPLLMQSASAIGIVGMNALAVFVFSAPALLASRGTGARFGLALAALLAAAHVGYGTYRLNAPPPAGGSASLAVRIVQPAIDQSQKWDASIRDRIFATHVDLTRSPPAEAGFAAQVVIWPETALPYLLTERSDALAAIGQALSPGQVLLTGAVRAEGEAGAPRRFYNSIGAVGTEGEILDAADKVHLVPFGEYLPMEELLAKTGLTKIVATPISFSSGASRKLLELPGGARALPLICYEVIFPKLADEPDADLIVNVTNDAWFGDTPGPYQHFRQAQVLAVTTGLPLMRAANTGISGVIDPWGRVVDALSLGTRGVVDVDVPLLRAGPFPLGRPDVNGLVTVLFFGLFAVAFRMR